MPQKIQMRNGTAAQWTAANPVLLPGEVGIETDTGYMKVGDGNTAWNSKTYIGVGPTASQIIAADGRSVQQILNTLLGTAPAPAPSPTPAPAPSTQYTEYAEDNFNRADANPIGSPWVQMKNENQMQLIGNRMKSSLSVGGGVYNLRQPSEVYRDNQFSEFLFADAINGDAGPMIGAVPNDYLGYALVCKTNVWRIARFKVTYSEPYVLGNTNQAQSNDVVGLRKVWVNPSDHSQGMDIIISLNNVDIGHFIDTDPVLGGSPAVYAYNNDVRFGRWRGGSTDKPWTPGSAVSIRGSYGS